MANPRTRRRIIFAIVFATLALGVTHWRLTQGVDRRLVGTWSVTTPTTNKLFWRLGGYGRGEMYVERNGKRLTALRYTWEVRGTVLEITSHNDARTIAKRIQGEWQIMRKKLTGEPLWIERYEILEIGPNVISLKDEENERVTMRRPRE